MKRLAVALSAALALCLITVVQRSDPPAVQAAQPTRSEFLIRFGVDGTAADWSGNISGPTRIRGWQFDAEESIDGSAWKCSTRQENYWDTPYERRMGPTAHRSKTTQKGILVEIDNPGELRIHTAQGDFSFDPALRLWSAPRRVLNGRVEVRSTPAAEIVSANGEASDYPSMTTARDGTLWLAYQAWSDGSGDRIVVRRRKSGIWSDPESITPGGEDLFRTAVAEDGAGRVWVIWSAQKDGNFDLWARAWDGKRWLPPERLSSAPDSDIFHSVARDAKGNLVLVWQSARSGNFDIYAKIYDGRRWSSDIQVSSDPASDWEPTLAAASGGRVTILWDTYARGNYDVVARTLEAGKLGPLTTIASSGAFEARPTAAYDSSGRLWVAWEEGDWNWGKDYGNLIPESGRGLLVRRQVRVGVIVSGQLMETRSPITEALDEEFRQAFLQPVLQFDSRGNLWVLFRYRTNLPDRRAAGEDVYRGMWRTAATTYQNGRWTPMMEFPEGYGRIDAPAALAISPDGVLDVAWESDGRLWPTGFPRDQNVLFAKLDQVQSATAPDLVPFQTSAENLAPSHPAEAADLKRIRAYRARMGSHSYQIVRGDLHRHTDISWDGNRDGSLNDAYRYALDAAGFDYLGVCDHQAGQGVPYHWWMIQKAADLFAIRNRFAPLYSYERSLPFPNGHRNVFFSKRGRSILPIASAEVKGVEGAAKLYEYLRRFGGLTSSHTSATGAGTDWRDSDEQVEPVVEIYQGYRNNFEGAATPRAAAGNEPVRFAAGFVWNAWRKGIRLGVQSSSDHVSTHISYAGMYVDRLDRDAILDAIRARRTYAATDNIIVTTQMGDHFMGEQFTAQSVPPLNVYVRGTGPLKQVSIVKNSQVVYVAPGASEEIRFSFTDTDGKPGTAYYYARVEQNDGQIAWSSPLWVTVGP